MMLSSRLWLVLPLLGGIAIVARYFLFSPWKVASPGPIPVRDAIMRVINIPDVEAIDADDQLRRFYIQDSVYLPEFGYAVARAQRAPLPRFSLKPDSKLCSSTEPPLAVIAIRGADETRRAWIRKNWARIGAEGPGVIRIFFEIRQKSLSKNDPLKKEMSDYGDVLELANTPKGGEWAESLFQWIGTNCKNSVYLVYWESDSAPINFSILKDYMNSNKRSDLISFIGKCSPDLRTPRKTVPKRIWPFTSFPQYPDGPLVLFTNKAVSALANANAVMPEVTLVPNGLWFGLWALASFVTKCTELPNIVMANEPVTIEEVQSHNCSASVVVHPYTSEWDALYNYWDTCKTKGQ